MRLDEFVILFEAWLSKHPFLYRIVKRIKVFVQRIIYLVLKLVGLDRRFIYGDGFFEQNLKTNLPIAMDLVDILYENFHPKSVVDVGCGTAEYLAEFQKKGVKIKGYEGSKSAIKKAQVDANFIQEFDLRNKIKDVQRYDLAICLEVAEHIESRYSQTLIDNLASLGDVVVFSAATPLQGGQFHINEQPREFWMRLWVSKNYVYHDSLTNILKEEMKKRNILKWYYENLMVFKKNF